MARVTDAMLESLIKNDGYVDGVTEVSPTGVQRLALDLTEARDALRGKDAIIEDKDHLVKALQFAVDRRGKEIDHLKALLNRPEVAEALVRSLAMEIRADVEKVAFAPDPVPSAPKKCAKKGKKKAKSRKSR